MRIVSQDRTLDINYDNVIVYRYDKEIVLADKIDKETSIRIAEYATPERAKEVMADIRKSFQFSFPNATSEINNFYYEMPEN